MKQSRTSHQRSYCITKQIQIFLNQLRHVKSIAAWVGPRRKLVGPKHDFASSRMIHLSSGGEIKGYNMTLSCKESC